MGKLLAFIGITIPCVIFGLLPEIVMYFTWGLIDPVTVLERILTVGLFWVVGGGLCILFAWLALILWAFVLSVFFG